ncbi:MAG: DUF120 domain-containing protein [Thermoplasmatota archaeon]
MFGGSKGKENITLDGRVTSGKNRGKFFLSKEKYKEQFIELLNIDPKMGTLNIELIGDDVEKFRSLKGDEGIKIEGFVEEGKKFGDVIAYPAKIDDIDCALVIPEKTDHENIIEIISDHKLRDELGVEDGDKLTVKIIKDWD